MTARDLVSYLAGQGLGVEGTTLFAGSLPDQPDSAIAVVPYPGVPPRYTHDGEAASYPRVQVIVRAATVAAAETSDAAVATALARIASVPLGGTLYQRLTPLSSGALYDRDATGRSVLRRNYEATTTSA